MAIGDKWPPEAIFEMLVMENNKKPKLWFFHRIAPIFHSFTTFTFKYMFLLVYPRLSTILAFENCTEEHQFCVLLLKIYHSQKYTFWGKYCIFVTNRSWMMENRKFGFLSFSMAGILKMAPEKPYIHKLSLLTCLFVIKTYILIKLFVL